ncbi:MAG: CBS domain-containing protein [Pseudomonadota bacterium]|nr:CBS domain-containing protein [Xanthomonadaceae bacterium]MDE3209861.1 CBS domain-containing protein [Pseudomonadota bacterium]
MSFHPVATHLDAVPVAVASCRAGEEAPLAAEDPALTAMADFHRSCPVTVEPQQKIDAALQQMIGAGVRTLLVMADQQLVGLITAYDIQGQRPLQFLHGSDCIHPKCRHQDIEVADIMTPMAALPTLRLADVRTARIGDILATFRATRRTHLLVTDAPDGERMAVRGLISLGEIERRLGLSPAHASVVLTEQELSAFPRAVRPA